MHWLLRWGHGRFDWSWNAWTPCAWQASSLRRAWKHGRVFFKTWSNWDHGVETNLFKVAAMGNGACGTRIFFCHHLWMSQKNRDLYLWIWKLKNRRKIVLSVCNSGLLDFKMTFFANTYIPILQTISANAGHGFHLRLAAQNAKEPSFFGKMCMIKLWKSIAFPISSDGWPPNPASGVYISTIEAWASTVWAGPCCGWEGSCKEKG